MTYHVSLTFPTSEVGWGRAGRGKGGQPCLPRPLATAKIGVWPKAKIICFVQHLVKEEKVYDVGTAHMKLHNLSLFCCKET
jgi:hypothetical protein